MVFASSGNFYYLSMYVSKAVFADPTGELDFSKFSKNVSVHDANLIAASLIADQSLLHVFADPAEC